MILLKYNYFDLLSSEPIKLQNVGSVVSPTLRNISSIGGYDTYQYYLTILLLDLKKYLIIIGKPEQYELISEEDKLKINIFDLLTLNEQSCLLLQNVLNFFIKENVRYSQENKCYIVQDNEKNVGTITKENYKNICDLICQRNCVKSNQEEDLSKIRSKKALEILEKLKKGRTEKEKQSKTDKNMELGNIISAVANKSQSLNMLNIWDLTVFQIWDCFARLNNNNIYDIQSMSVATWGDKDHHFDATAWFKKIDTNN